MKFILFLSILILASCQKEEVCGSINETCTTYQLQNAGRCNDEAWVPEFSEKTYLVKTHCSKKALIDQVEAENEAIQTGIGIPYITISCAQN